nr:unnamed protein product [Callosobruchus chinensis]
MQPGMGDLKRMLALEASVMLVLLCSIPTEANPVGICIRNCGPSAKRCSGPTSKVNCVQMPA